MTMEYSGHTNDVGHQTLIITKTVAYRTAFKKFIDSKMYTKDREWIAEIIMNEMKK